MQEIKVHVVTYSNRTNLVMRYVDPTTGKQITRSTGTSKRREAERTAAKWESELQDGRYKSPAKITWEEFRQRYEDEHLAPLSDETAKKVNTTFGLVERIIRPVRLRDVTSEQVSRWIAIVQEEGRAVATVRIYCAHLQSSLNWAKDIGLLHETPKIKAPRRTDGKMMKGRPIVLEEHERMLVTAGKVASAKQVDAAGRFLDGLWWSGLRIGEACRISWEPSAVVSVVMQPGYHPAIKFRVKGHKARRDELVPCAPEFAELLEAVLEDQRSGFVFDLPRADGAGRLSVDRVSRLVSDIGAAAGVLIDETSGKHATAHDYRRAFGTRWAKRVMPATLKRLMRHKDISTTLKYYVDQDAEDIAEDLWAAYRKATGVTGSNPGSIEEKGPTILR